LNDQRVIDEIREGIKKNKFLGSNENGIETPWDNNFGT
jgi:hypothetical protein